MRRRAVLLGGLCAAAASGGADIPIEVSGGRCVVTVLLDGRPARMLLDTGAERSVMAREAVARLGLRRDPWVATTMRGAGGLLERNANVDVGVARAGGVALVQHAQGGGLSLPVTSGDLGGVDGLLGGDVLGHYVVDLDVPHARLGLRASGVAGGVPLQLLRRDLLLAPVRLDGHALVALLDTGASVSLVNARGAYRLGLAAAGDPVVSLHALGGESVARVHRFGEFRVGPLSVTGPEMLTQTVPEAAYDLVLGLDVLGRQRIVLSYPGLTLGFFAN